MAENVLFGSKYIIWQKIYYLAGNIFCRVAKFDRNATTDSNFMYKNSCLELFHSSALKLQNQITKIED